MSECKQSLFNKTDLETPLEQEKGFLPCYPVFNEYHKCVTKEKYGDLSSLPPKYEGYFKNFSNCIFKEIKSLDLC